MTLRFTALLSVILIPGLISCKTPQAETNSPKNLDDAILFFQQNWTKTELDIFRMKAEDEAVSDAHFGSGLWVRNNWIRGGRDTSFVNYFHSLGVYHPDDSSIVFTSLHRVLNNKAINLDEQIKPYQEYWEEISDCEKREKDSSVAAYDRFSVGDNVSIFMQVDTSADYRNAVLHVCPDTEWTFDAGKDLVIKGRIVNKFFINDPANVFFTVKIESLSDSNTKILMNPVVIGEEKDFLLRGITIK
jgi:hypothetical protein